MIALSARHRQKPVAPNAGIVLGGLFMEWMLRCDTCGKVMAKDGAASLDVANLNEPSREQRKYLDQLASFHSGMELNACAAQAGWLVLDLPDTPF